MNENKECDVQGCKNPAFKSVSREKAKEIFSLKSEGRRVHLCKEHYKEFKKKTKKEREIERLGWVR
ncbi:MAG: hypothetical protein RXP30_03290 [Thermoplasmata archaeon]|jgi:hypothetical protein|nr:hypothetical protein [Thermoplasmata archaeon]MVT13567.1 hypothetical protein [Euryarchaeota archaeon]MVT14185.1 hypothetical protein [Euryarchaeota archaeon]MVT36397.1 hypothetical protein [Euryarchaeota archaeon]